MLLHITSLPGPSGVGDLGRAAYRFVDLMHQAGQSWWQVLPLGPTGYGDSPYQCFSAFAGNPLLIGLEQLEDEGLLRPGDVAAPRFLEGTVDYAAADQFKQSATRKAFERFEAGAGARLAPAFETFCLQEAAWLDPYAIFLVIKRLHRHVAWQEWAEAFRHRQSAALRRVAADHADELRLNKFRQFLFFHQWAELRDYARDRGVRFMGDMPIFVANDSSDVWFHPELFQLDAQGLPSVVAGVPPDYFTEDGQRWGNPLYRWEEHERTGFAWWIERLRSAFALFDLVRLDHFRGFEGYWTIPAESPTARGGWWTPAPGRQLLARAAAEFGGLPIVAEDLGEITPPVHSLRAEFGLPGMRVLQFAFGGAQEDRFLPHHFDRPSVVYTGTHDNETTRGWYAQLTPRDREFFQHYAPSDGTDPVGDLIRLGWASVAFLAIAPLQDVLRLGNEARMNYPGRPTGNWRWRADGQTFDGRLLEGLRQLSETYQRLPVDETTPQEPSEGNSDDAE